jgi:hypothetical protein
VKYSSGEKAFEFNRPLSPRIAIHCLVSDAPYFSSGWVGIAMLSRRTWCARALLALLAGLSRVAAMALLAGLPRITLLALLAGLSRVAPIALLAGLPRIALLALLAGLPLRTWLSRGPLQRSWGWAYIATANKYD